MHRMFRVTMPCAILAGLALMFLASCSSEYDKHYDLAKQLKDEDRFEEAIKEYELAAQADPTRAKPYYRIAQIQKNLGQHKEAAATLEKGVEVEPDYEELYPELVKNYRRDGQLDKAEEWAKKALELPVVKRNSEAQKEIEIEMAEIENARRNPPAPAPTPEPMPVMEPITTEPVPGEPMTTSTGALSIPPAEPNSETGGKVEDVK